MMVEKVTVHAANFECKQIVVGLAKNAKSLVITTPQNNYISVLYSSLVELETVSEANVKTVSSSFGASALGALAFGGAGMVAGAIMGGNKNEVTFTAKFDDGKQLFGSVGRNAYQEMQGALAQKSFAETALINLDEGLPPQKGRGLFWLAVVIVPAIAVWFTLQKKYTRTERVVAFGWFALFIAFSIAGKT